MFLLLFDVACPQTETKLTKGVGIWSSLWLVVDLLSSKVHVYKHEIKTQAYKSISDS